MGYLQGFSGFSSVVCLIIHLLENSYCFLKLFVTKNVELTQSQQSNEWVFPARPWSTSSSWWQRELYSQSLGDQVFRGNLQKLKYTALICTLAANVCAHVTHTAIRMWNLYIPQNIPSCPS